jgi:hypothetical protein
MSSFFTPHVKRSLAIGAGLGALNYFGLDETIQTTVSGLVNPFLGGNLAIATAETLYVALWCWVYFNFLDDKVISYSTGFKS